MPRSRHRWSLHGEFSGFRFWKCQKCPVAKRVRLGTRPLLTEFRLSDSAAFAPYNHNHDLVPECEHVPKA